MHTHVHVPWPKVLKGVQRRCVLGQVATTLAVHMRPLLVDVLAEVGGVELTVTGSRAAVERLLEGGVDAVAHADRAIRESGSGGKDD